MATWVLSIFWDVFINEVIEGEDEGGFEFKTNAFDVAFFDEGNDAGSDVDEAVSKDEIDINELGDIETRDDEIGVKSFLYSKPEITPINMKPRTRKK